MDEKSELVRRSYQFEARAEPGEEGHAIITGRAIVYESPTNIGGMFREVISRGALDEADLSDVAFLVNHNDSMIPLARYQRDSSNNTMTIDVDVNGLPIRADLDIANNLDARALRSAIERGDMNGMSFMFSIESQRWENLNTDYPTRFIDKIGKVYEVSAVTFPAYTETSLSARDRSDLEAAKSELGTARKSNKRDYDARALMAAYKHNSKGGNEK